MNLKLVVVLILALLAALFMVQNATVVEIRFLIWSVQMSRALLILLLLAVGTIIGWFLCGFFRRRSRKVI